MGGCVSTPNIEWDVAHELITPYADIDLNAVIGPGMRYQILPDGYEIIPSVRVTNDNISQANGSVLHTRWKTGLTATMTVAYWMKGGGGNTTVGATAADEPACGAELRVMNETLMGALNSILKLTDQQQRLVWQPTGYPDRRMLTDIQVLDWSAPSYDVDGELAQVTFSVETPFPYAIDETQQVTAISASGSATIANAGNCESSPVVQVHGPTSSFTLTNNSEFDPEGSVLSVVYDSSRPGAVSIGPSDYAEIDMFRGTIILNGDVTDLIAGLDPATTDFWHLVPGDNLISIIGAACTVLSNNAWT